MNCSYIFSTSLVYLVYIGHTKIAADNYSSLEKFLNQERTDDIKAPFSPEDFPFLLNAIAQAVGQSKQNSNNNRKSLSVALFTHQSCMVDENIIKLKAVLNRFKTINIKCHQLILPLQTGDIEYIGYSHRQVTILLLPWYMTEFLLERLALYGIDRTHYVTVGVSQPYIRLIKNIDTYMKISNILKKKTLQDDCRMLDAFASNISHQRKNVWICTSIESRPLKIATNLFKGMQVFHLPGIIPGPGMIKECPPGSLPCRKSSKKNKKRIWDWFCCRGQLIDLLILILIELPSAYDIYFVEDNQFGILVNGSWNGIINEVLQKRADLGLHVLNVVKQRFNVVDFTSPIRDHPESFGVLIKKLKPTYLILNWSFLRILQPELLVACFFVTILITIFVITTERSLLGKSKGKRYRKKEGMSAIAGILLQRDLGAIISQTWSGQTFSAFFALGMTVFIASYSANLIANNIDKEESVFNGFEDEKFKSPAYRVGLIKGTASTMYYSRLSDLFAEKVYFKWRPYQALVDGPGYRAWFFSLAPSLRSDFFSRSSCFQVKVIDAMVCSSYLNQEYLDSLSEFGNQLQMYRDDRYQMDYAFAIQKNSVVGKKISNIISMLGQQGKLKEIIDKWAIKKPNHHHENTRFPFEYAGGYILVIGCAVGICVVIVLLENLYTSVKRKRRRIYNVNNSDTDLSSTKRKDLTYSNERNVTLCLNHYQESLTLDESASMPNV